LSFSLDGERNFLLAVSLPCASDTPRVEGCPIGTQGGCLVWTWQVAESRGVNCYEALCFVRVSGVFCTQMVRYKAQS
jgi:hypothetical protein